MIWNLKILCLPCHRWWHNNILVSASWFKEKFPARYDYLMIYKNEIKQFRVSDLEELVDKLKVKLKELSDG